MSNWWYKDRGEQKGPVTRMEMQALLTHGTIGPDTPVWSRDTRAWQPIRRHGEFSIGRTMRARVRPRVALIAGLLVLLFAGAAAMHYSGQALQLTDRVAATAAPARPGYIWTNPVTGRKVSVAQHWRYKLTTSDDGLAMHQFYLTEKGKVVVAVHEADPDGDGFEDYARAMYGDMMHEWEGAKGRLEHFRGRPSWRAHGTKNNRELRIDLRLLQVKSGIWRVAVIERDPAQAASDVTDLTDGIWDSLAPRKAT